MCFTSAFAFALMVSMIDIIPSPFKNLLYDTSVISIPRLLYYSISFPNTTAHKQISRLFFPLFPRAWLSYNVSMKSVGIIAEYNPFHNGHAYQLQKAKEASGAILPLP
ncbi:MAG: nucleotidyltransferase family protein [Christensenellales bacterium]